jgi:hypothetical protein
VREIQRKQKLEYKYMNCQPSTLVRLYQHTQFTQQENKGLLPSRSAFALVNTTLAKRQQALQADLTMTRTNDADSDVALAWRTKTQCTDTTFLVTQYA